MVLNWYVHGGHCLTMCPLTAFKKLYYYFHGDRDRPEKEWMKRKWNQNTNNSKSIWFHFNSVFTFRWCYKCYTRFIPNNLHIIFKQLNNLLYKVFALGVNYNLCKCDRNGYQSNIKTIEWETYVLQRSRKSIKWARVKEWMELNEGHIIFILSKCFQQ